MDELPRDARSVLALAKNAHDPPDPAARERVRGKVLAAVAPAALGAGLPTLAKARPSTIPTWLGATKGMLTSALMLLAVGGGVWSLRPAQPAPEAHESAAVLALPSPAAAGTVAAPAPVPTLQAPTLEPALAAASPAPAAPLTRGSRARRTAATGVDGSSLRAELGLLARAAEQLERGDAQAALAALTEHRRRFAHTQLAQERDGLWVMTHCRQQRAGAQREARAFLARSPTAVLATRVEQACGL